MSPDSALLGWLELGWLGAALLVASGLGWGRQLARGGVTGATLGLMLLGTVLGLTLVAGAFLAGHDLPLTLGVTGALAGAVWGLFHSGEPPDR